MLLACYLVWALRCPCCVLCAVPLLCARCVLCGLRAALCSQWIRLPCNPARCVALNQCPCRNQSSVVAVRCVCAQEAEAARTLQAQGAIAELQRQLVSGTRRAQHPFCLQCVLRVYCVRTSLLFVGCVLCGLHAAL